MEHQNSVILPKISEVIGNGMHVLHVQQNNWLQRMSGDIENTKIYNVLYFDVGRIFDFCGPQLRFQHNERDKSFSLYGTDLRRRLELIYRGSIRQLEFKSWAMENPSVVLVSNTPFMEALDSLALESHCPVRTFNYERARAIDILETYWNYGKPSPIKGPRGYLLAIESALSARFVMETDELPPSNIIELCNALAVPQRLIDNVKMVLEDKSIGELQLPSRWSVEAPTEYLYKDIAGLLKLFKDTKKRTFTTPEPKSRRTRLNDFLYNTWKELEQQS